MIKVVQVSGQVKIAAEDPSPFIGYDKTSSPIAILAENEGAEFREYMT